MKITAKEWKEIDNDDMWNGDWYVEDVIFKVNGVETAVDDWPDKDLLKDTDIVTIVGGDICFIEGCKVKPKQRTYESYLENLLKEKSTVSFVVECDKTIIESLKSLIKSNGGKV